MSRAASPILSRRAALVGAVAASGALATSSGCAPDPVPARNFPAGPLTFAQASVLDFAALWTSLPMEAQARIGAMALRAETFDQVGQDGGFHTTAEHRDMAQAEADDARNALPALIWAALPAVLPTVHDEPYPLWQVLDSREPPAMVDVRGLGRRPLVKAQGRWCARVGADLVELGGAVDLDSRDEAAPARWLFWPMADIDAERARRHPELAISEGVS